MIDAATLDTLGKPDVLEALRLVPGAQVAQAGQRGGVPRCSCAAARRTSPKCSSTASPANDIGGGLDISICVDHRHRSRRSAARHEQRALRDRMRSAASSASPPGAGGPACRTSSVQDRRREPRQDRAKTRRLAARRGASITSPPSQHLHDREQRSEQRATGTIRPPGRLGVAPARAPTLSGTMRRIGRRSREPERDSATTGLPTIRRWSGRLT